MEDSYDERFNKMEHHSLNDIVQLNVRVDRFLVKEGFVADSFDDCYSGSEGKVVFHKRLGKDEHTDSYTAVVTSKGEIGIERHYSYGGGNSAGLWKFKPDSPEDFMNTYKEFVDTVQYLVQNEGLRLAPIKYK